MKTSVIILTTVVIILMILMFPMYNEGFHGSSGTGVIMFYANGCGHCEKLKPIWRKLKSTYVTLQSIEAKGNGVLLDRYGITGFPTIIKIKNGDLVSKYSGDRSIEDLSRYIENG